MESYLQIGKIITTHGIKGEVKVLPLTDDPTRFEIIKNIIIEEKNTVDPKIIKNSKELSIENVKYFKDKVILKFKSIDDIETAEALRNVYLLVNRKDAVKLPENHYFICDLVGCMVYDENASELGKLVNIFPTGSNDVYVVRNRSGEEILIPAIKSVVKSVDIDNKIIKVELPEGLL